MTDIESIKIELPCGCRAEFRGGSPHRVSRVAMIEDDQGQFTPGCQEHKNAAEILAYIQMWGVPGTSSACRLP